MRTPGQDWRDVRTADQEQEEVRTPGQEW
jgi:hypothetical protein